MKKSMKNVRETHYGNKFYVFQQDLEISKFHSQISPFEYVLDSH